MFKVSQFKIFLSAFFLFSHLALASEAALIRLHSEPLSSLKARIESIRHSQKEILIEAFYLEDDEVGNTLLQEMLNQKKKYPRLKIQILTDAWGSASLPKDKICYFKNSGFEWKQFNPVGTFELSFKTQRTHRKIWLTDEESFIGGRNLADENFLLGQKGTPAYDDWDVEIKNGSIQEQIKNSFVEMWNKAKEIKCGPQNQALKAEPSAVLELIKDVHLSEFKNADLNWYTETINSQNLVFKKVMQLLADTKHSLHAENAYFIPPENLTELLKSLDKKGIPIALLLNAIRVDAPTMGFNTGCLSAFEQADFLNTNIQVYNSKSYTHAKAFLIDNRILGIGSFNWDYRSAIWNSETLLTIENSQVIDEFKNHFLQRQLRSRLITKPSDFWPHEQVQQRCETNKSLLFMLKKYF